MAADQALVAPLVVECNLPRRLRAGHDEAKGWAAPRARRGAWREGR